MIVRKTKIYETDSFKVYKTGYFRIIHRNESLGNFDLFDFKFCPSAIMGNLFRLTGYFGCVKMNGRRLNANGFVLAISFLFCFDICLLAFEIHTR